VLAIGGCSQGIPSGLVNHTYSGRVRLIGTLIDVNGDSTGVQIIDDADSVRVFLLVGGFVSDSTLTVDGRYEFRGLRSGQVAASSRVAGPVVDTTKTQLLTGNAVASDTLLLRSTFDLLVYPNPFPFSTRIQFGVPADVNVDLTIERLDGVRVRTLANRTFVAGLHQFLWDGTDDAGATLGPGRFWVVFRSGADVRARLIEKTP
jgi:hypothetical protein